MELGSILPTLMNLLFVNTYSTHNSTVSCLLLYVSAAIRHQVEIHTTIYLKHLVFLSLNILVYTG